MQADIQATLAQDEAALRSRGKQRKRPPRGILKPKSLRICSGETKLAPPHSLEERSGGYLLSSFLQLENGGFKSTLVRWLCPISKQ